MNKDFRPLSSALMALICLIASQPGDAAADGAQVGYLLSQIPPSIAGWAPDEALIKTACRPFRDCCTCPNADPACPRKPADCGFRLFRADAYDQALAVMALMDAGESGAAARILNGIARVMADTASGHVKSFYVVEQGCGDPPSYTAIYPEPSALDLTATNAWVLQAINDYESRTCDGGFEAMAGGIAQWIDSFRQRTPSGCPTSGAVSMGLDSPAGSGSSQFGPARVDAAEFLARRTAPSVAEGQTAVVPYSKVYNAEGNVVSSVALKQRSWLTRDPAIAAGLASGAQASKDFVVGVLWSGNTPPALSPPAGGARFFAGVDTSAGCRLDPDAYLDSQVLSNLAFGAYGSNGERFLDALDYARTAMAGQGPGGCPGSAATPLSGLRPAEGSSGFVWLEGGEMMASACAAGGDGGCAAFYHGEAAKAVSTSGPCAGGVLYATENAEGFEECPAAASTAWFAHNEIAGAVSVFDYGRAVASSLKATAVPSAGEVVLEWIAGGACPGQAYNVYRSTSPTDVMRAENLRGMQPTTLTGVYRDPVLWDGVSYFYLVEEVAGPGPGQAGGAKGLPSTGK